MQSIIVFLKANQSYLWTIALGLVGIFWTQGWIDDTTAALLGGWCSARAGLSVHANRQAKKL